MRRPLWVVAVSIACTVVFAAQNGCALPTPHQSTSSFGTSESGPLAADSMGAASCDAREMLFLKGEQVRLSGSGFEPNAAVDIELTTGDREGTIATIIADANGRLDETVTLPIGDSAAYPAHTIGIIDAVGPSPTGTLWLTVVIEIATPSGDSDGDGIPDYCDTCPGASIADNTDTDGDGLGDACDPCPTESDTDRDGICDSVDPCKFDPDNDSDGDGICGNQDNCPTVSNENQADSNEDGIGDACAPSGPG